MNLFTNWERVNKKIYHEINIKININFIFLHELVKKMKTLSRSICAKNQRVSFDFPKRKFGQEERSFKLCWYEFFPWLHYDLEKDVAFCATCVSQEKKGNLVLSSKKEEAFPSTGCSNWKKALEKLMQYESSHCHLKASTMSVSWETHEDIG